jgi:chromosome segregation ATPase
MAKKKRLLEEKQNMEQLITNDLKEEEKKNYLQNELNLLELQVTQLKSENNILENEVSDLLDANTNLKKSVDYCNAEIKGLTYNGTRRF